MRHLWIIHHYLIWHILLAANRHGPLRGIWSFFLISFSGFAQGQALWFVRFHAITEQRNEVMESFVQSTPWGRERNAIFTKIKSVKKHENKTRQEIKRCELNTVNWILMAFSEQVSTLLLSGAELMSSTKPSIVNQQRSSVFQPCLIAAIIFVTKQLFKSSQLLMQLPGMWYRE